MKGRGLGLVLDGEMSYGVGWAWVGLRILFSVSVGGVWD